MRLRAISAWPEIAGASLRMVTIFSRPAGPSLAARYSWPRPVAPLSSRRTSLPNFSRMGIQLDAESNTHLLRIQIRSGLFGQQQGRFDTLRITDADASLLVEREHLEAGDRVSGGSQY